jgi:hypothetical protein
MIRFFGKQSLARAVLETGRLFFFPLIIQIAKKLAG